VKLGSLKENEIPIENFVIPMIYVYTPAHNYATLKRMPLFNFPLVWNAVGVERNNPRQHLFINHQRNALLLDLQ
jgi:hypothetical protein